MIRVAMVGAGGISRAHSAAYRAIPAAEVVAVVDVNEEAARAAAESLGAVAFTDFDAMLLEADVDAVDICTPTAFHKDYAVKAAAAGKHILVEKPMARTVDDCREMIDAARDAGVELMVAQVLRFFPEFRTARDQVLAGAVGRPAVIRTTRGGGHPGRWFGDVERSGGVVLDLMVHDLDWLRWTFGEVERVQARGHVGDEERGLDYSLVILKMKSGAIAHAEGTWARPDGFRFGFEIAGSEGLLSFDSREVAPLRIAVREGDSCAPVVQSPVVTNPYYLEIKHFIDCVEHGRRPEVTGEDGMRAVEIACAALRSIETGAPVELGGE